MKKIFALLIVLLVGLLPVNAQRDVQKEMNRIKSSPNYVYGEATRADREEALDAAFEEMMHEADQWAAEQTHDKDVELSSDDVRELVESLETKHSGLIDILTKLSTSLRNGYMPDKKQSYEIMVVIWQLLTVGYLTTS